MKSWKPIPVPGKRKCLQLVFKLLTLAIMLQCTQGLHTAHLPDADDEYDVISEFHGLSGIQCSLKCTTSPEKCDAIASEAEGGKTGSCKLLKFAGATAISLAPPNRLNKRMTKANITVFKPNITPVAGAWGDWSTWTGPCWRGPCNNVMKKRTRACDAPAPLHFGPSCPGANNESVPCGTLDCVYGVDAAQYCQSQSMSLAAVPNNYADKQAFADDLPVPNLYYWVEFIGDDPPSGYTHAIKSRPGQSYSYIASSSWSSVLLPAACV